MTPNTTEKAMDPLSIQFYQLHFKVHFFEKKAAEFQNWFWDIMDACHPGDFLRVKPWGNAGDKKNDGYLKSEKALFAVYGPEEMTQAKSLAKLNSDFAGALPHWKEWFVKWVFVHNAYRGLSPALMTRLLELRKEHEPIDVTSWGFSELRAKLFEKPDPNVLLVLFGLPATTATLNDLGYEHLRPVLAAIQRISTVDGSPIKEVPPEKLLANNLSQEVQNLLQAGSTRTPVVAKFFATYYDANLGNELAQRFKHEYQKLRAEGKEGDEIFMGLQKFAGGTSMNTPQHQVAVLTVLAYFFERCEIFEAAPASKAEVLKA